MKTKILDKLKKQKLILSQKVIEITTERTFCWRLMVSLD